MPKKKVEDRILSTIHLGNGKTYGPGQEDRLRKALENHKGVDSADDELQRLADEGAIQGFGTEVTQTGDPRLAEAGIGPDEDQAEDPDATPGTGRPEDLDEDDDPETEREPAAGRKTAAKKTTTRKRNRKGRKRGGAKGGAKNAGRNAGTSSTGNVGTGASGNES